MPTTIKHKRGIKTEVLTGSLQLGEIGFCTDTKQVFISDGIGKSLVGRVVSGLLTDRPTPSVSGSLYYATDTNQFFVETPEYWIEISSQPNPAKEYTLSEDWIANNFEGSLHWSRARSGGGDAVSTTIGLDANHQGLVDLNVSSGSCTLHLGTSKIFLSGGLLSYQTAVYIPQLASSSQNFICWTGLGDTSNSDEHIDGVYFEYNRNNSLNWVCKTSTDSIRTSVTTNVAVEPSTWFNLAFISNADGTEITFLINRNIVATVTTNIPNAIDRTCSPNYKILKTNGSISRSMILDFFYLRKIFTNLR